MARQPNARSVKKPSGAPASTPARLTLPAAAAFSSDVRTLAVNLAILAIILLIVPVVAVQFLRNQVLIEPLAVPTALQASGLTPEVAANRLWDGIEQIKDAADTGKGGVSAVPDSQQVSFSIPDSGLSIDSLIYYVRQFFHAYETRISGEFRCADAACTPGGVTLRLRIVREGLDFIQLPPVGDLGEDRYFRDAAAEVLSVIDPFVALAARARGEPDKARVLAERLIRTGHPDAKWAHNLLGNLSIDDGRIAEAKAQYEAALALDRDFLPALANIGNVMRIEGDRDGARAAFEAVDKADPGNAFAAAGLADLALLDGRQDDAIALLLAASRRDPLNPHYLYRAGIVAFDRSDVEAARQHLEQALAIDAAHEPSLALLSAIYMLAGDLDGAERIYRTAANLAPDNAAILAAHARQLRFLQYNDEALVRIEAAIALDPGRVPYRISRAELLQQLDRNGDALAELLRVRDMEPDNADALYDLGQVYRELNRGGDALAAFRRFTELAPDDPRAGAVAIWMEELEPAAMPALPGAVG